MGTPVCVWISRQSAEVMVPGMQPNGATLTTSDAPCRANSTARPSVMIVSPEKFIGTNFSPSAMTSWILGSRRSSRNGEASCRGLVLLALDEEVLQVRGEPVRQAERPLGDAPLLEGVGIQDPLADRRQPGLAAEPLDGADDVVVREDVAADVNLADHADERARAGFFPAGHGGDAPDGVAERGPEVVASIHGPHDPLDPFMHRAVGGAGFLLVRPHFAGGLPERVRAEDAVPERLPGLLGQALVGVAAAGGEDRDVAVAEAVEDQALEDGVLAEAAGPVRARA